MTEYTVVIHRAGESWNAYAPDIDGLGAAADTREEVVELITSALAFHLRKLREDGDEIPSPSAEAMLVRVAS